jgi:hypothetical protein
MSTVLLDPIARRLAPVAFTAILAIASAACESSPNGGGGTPPPITSDASVAPGSDGSTTAKTDGGSTTNQDGGTMTSMDATPNAGCMGQAIMNGGALDLDIKSIKISGNVTLNGAPLPAMRAGALSFNDAHSHSVLVALPASGTYAVELAPGTYDVHYTPSNACAQDSMLPCSGGLLKSGVALMSSGALDLDIQAVSVTGAITLNGQPLPEGVPRGQILFVAGAGQPARGAINASGAGKYGTSLAPGTYDVVYVPMQSCASGSSMLPCNGGILMSGVSLQSSGALDLDIKSVAVMGRVTLDGQAMPAGPRGAISFGQPVSSVSPIVSAFSRATFVLPESGDAASCQGCTTSSGSGETAPTPSSRATSRAGRARSTSVRRSSRLEPSTSIFLRSKCKA